MNLTIKNASSQTVYTSMFGIDTNCNWCLYNFSTGNLDECTSATTAMDYMYEMTGDIFIPSVPQLASGIVLFLAS